MPKPEKDADVWSIFAREAASFAADVRALPVMKRAAPGELRASLDARYTFERPVPLERLTAEVSALLREWTAHSTHPRAFGLFSPSVREAGVVADALASLYNPQLVVWAAAPGALELEQLTLRFLARLLGLPEAGLASHFTNGGAEANLTAVAAALARAFPAWAEGGVRALDAAPTVYLAQNAHDSFVKAVRLVGLGGQSIRRVPVTARHELDVGALAALVAEDRRAGHRPFFLVGTAGTTSSGAIDPLADLARLAAAEGLWLHVDAAWGGAAAFSPRLRPLLAGIERADSVVWDAHKWLAVPLAAGMFFCRHPGALRDAFRVSADYIPPVIENTDDPFTNTVQWSRRALGLKVFMALAELGSDGYTAIVERQTALGDALRARLRSAGWLVVNDAALPVVLFTHPRLRAREGATGQMLGAIYGRGRVLITDATLPDGERALRACVTSYHSDERDVDVLLEELALALDAVAGAGAG